MLTKEKFTANKALTIAGSDSGGGAGIQADLKTFAALGVYGTSVITALTAQNTLGVQGITGIPADFVEQQLDSIFEDIKPQYVKTGMLYNAEIIEKVAAKLAACKQIFLVVDPVMIATSGECLLAPEAINTLIKKLLPLAHCITPNVSEAAALSRTAITGKEELYHAARELLKMGPATVVITGFRENGQMLDLFYDGKEFKELYGEYLDTPHTHGTGCSFSAATTAFLAQGFSLSKALELAKKFVALGLCYTYMAGNGRNPLNHLAFYDPCSWEDPLVTEMREHVWRHSNARIKIEGFPALYAIIDSQFCQGKDYQEIAHALIKGGAKIIQLREKDTDTKSFLEKAHLVSQVCRAEKVLFIVNDRADIAAASGADGVHIGQEDISTEVARALLGPEKIVGVSAATLKEALLAEEAGADYIGFGPVYDTKTKNCQVGSCGPQLLAQVIQKVNLPVFPIGGITPENTPPLLQAGAAGVAVISAILGSPDPTGAALKFLKIFSTYQAKTSTV